MKDFANTETLVALAVLVALMCGTCLGREMVRLEHSMWTPDNVERK